MQPGTTPPLPDGAAGWALFLDIDGTLLEIASTPAAVIVPVGLKELLERLYGLAHGALALVSGRSLAQLDQLMAPLKLPMAGQHGLERRSSDGSQHHDIGSPAIPAAARDALTRVMRQHPQLMLEDKGATLALHYRMAPELQRIARQAAEEARQLAGTDHVLLEGKMVIEIKPATTSKSRAIAAFLEEQPFRGRTPVFIGDDLTDEAGFEYVNRHGGLSIQVGATPARGATYSLADVHAVHAWLEALARAAEQVTRP
ncbi:MAG TPA: trehalose-phosphatase [Steroidobacteraceae bacterium]|nr:trehalose-phosphatase [Steroidobacteraceae bacterium]